MIKDGFSSTKAWLTRNKQKNLEVSEPRSIIHAAYLELFDWNTKHRYPEIMSMDQERMKNLTVQAFRLCYKASVLAITSRIPVIKQNVENRRAILTKLTDIFHNISSKKYVFSEF